MHKIIARQVPPERQESPFEWAGTIWEDLNICGNRDYESHMSDTFRRLYERFDGARLLRALRIVTGECWCRRTIRGSCQREWQDIYCPRSAYSEDAIDVLTIEYFNQGSEWIVDVDGCSVSIYAYADSPDKIREEIADAVGVSVDMVQLMAFDGWSRTAVYKEV